MSERGPDYLINSKSKRGLDIVGGTIIALAFALPAFATGAVVAAEHGPRNLFFKQRRRSNRDETVIVRKFKTVKNSVDDISIKDLPGLLKEYLANGIADIPQLIDNGTFDEILEEVAALEQRGLIQAGSSTIDNFIRISALDESPQILSVLSGATSLTGPRLITDGSLESRMRAAPSLFNDWYTGVYEPLKKGWVSPGGNWYHSLGSSHDLTGQQIEIGVMERDLAWVPDATLAYDLRLLAEAPVDIISGLRNHLWSVRQHQAAVEARTHSPSPAY